jgi:hypothetical protein
MVMSNNISLNLSNQLLETPPSNSYHAKYLQQKPNQKFSNLIFEFKFVLGFCIIDEMCKINKYATVNV